VAGSKRGIINMTMLFRMCTAILLILISFEARGAEVVCHMTYAEGDSGPATAERGNKNFLTRWPSGALPTPSTCKIGLIRGPIIKGDYEKVLAFCRQNHPFLDTFLLQSPGGDVVDAIKIGTLFRKYLIVAEAPVHFNPPSPWPDTLAGYRRAGDTEGPVCRGADCVCASACALIWFGGAERSGSVGLHRPYFSEESAFKLLSPADAEKEYTKMLTSIGDFLEEMEVPKPIIETMTATGSAEITWIQDQSDNRPPGLTE